MEIIGLIAEYNPLHNGHIYQINKIKELYPSSLIILILSGYFTQRGTISYMTKEDKVKASLNENIDIILELPYIYATQSSDIFAYEAIKILNELHITHLAFGSESADINKIKEIADIQSTNKYNEEVKEQLKKGINYPTALALSLHQENFNYTPNDLLAISYLKAINKINSNIKPILIKRTNDYHDNTKIDNIISASNIRLKLEKKEDISYATPYYNLIKSPNYDTLYKLLKTKIITEKDLSIYLDVNEGIEYRLKKQIIKSNSLEELISNIKTKRYTYNKINRMLIHILIGLTKEDNISYPPYIKILGFNKLGQQYLSKENIISNQDKDNIIYKYELISSLIYDLIYNSNTYNYEIKNKPIIK